MTEATKGFRVDAMTATGTLTITDFLLARIAEDEKMANAALGSNAYAQNCPTTKVVMRSASGDALFEFDERRLREADPSTLALAEHFGAWNPACVLAECKAKRAIVDNHDGERSSTTGNYCGFEDGRFEIPCPELRHLAAVYASHPDYDSAWAPES